MVSLLVGCGGSDSGKTPAAGNGAAGAAASGGASSSNVGGAGGGGGASGKAGSAGAGGGCADGLISGDATCPSSPNAFVASDACSKEGATCHYQLATSTPGFCVNGDYTCCGGTWLGADECPSPIANEPAGCPSDLPKDTDPTNPPACSSAGLQCGYYPVYLTFQQDIGCCNGVWRVCAPSSPASSPNCPCP